MPSEKRRAEDDCEGSREPKRGKGTATSAGTINFKTWTKPATMTFLGFMKDALDAIREVDKTRLEANQADVEKLQAEIEKLKLQKEVEQAEIEKLKLQKEVEEARARSAGSSSDTGGSLGLSPASLFDDIVNVVNTAPQAGIEWDPSSHINTW